MVGRRDVQISPSNVRVYVQRGKQRIVRIAPLSVRISVLVKHLQLRCLNICSRLKDLHAGIRMRVKGRGLTRSTLYRILKDIVICRKWDMSAFVIFADFIDEIYNIVADICAICRVRRTTLLQYLAGFIGTSALQKHVVSTRFRICSPAY